MPSTAIDQNWKFGRRFISCNFWLSWVGIFILLVKILIEHGAPSDPNIASMFGALSLNLTATVGVIVGGKASEHWANRRYNADGSEDSTSETVQEGQK